MSAMFADPSLAPISKTPSHMSIFDDEPSSPSLTLPTPKLAT